MKKKKIFFILDKWCNGKHTFGLSEWDTNFWQSLAQTGPADYDLFHFDEYYHQYQKPGDAALLEKMRNYQPDAICLSIYKLPGSDFNVLSLKTLETIRKFFSVPLFAIWSNLDLEKQVELSEAILPFVDFNIFMATSAVFRRLKDLRKYSYFWAPKNPGYFYNPGRPRDIDISYLGSPKPDRLLRIKFLKKHGLKVYHTGGEREEHLPTGQFAGILQRSKITLSFSNEEHVPLTDARAFETTNCGALLLEEAGPETAKLFIPSVDYVPYFSNADLLKKVRYYLRHEDERVKIWKNR